MYTHTQILGNFVTVLLVCEEPVQGMELHIYLNCVKSVEQSSFNYTLYLYDIPIDFPYSFDS
jgi:hypothetical protein